MKTFVKIVIALILLTSIIMSATSCAIKISAEELSKGYKREDGIKVEYSENSDKKITDFSYKFFNKIIEKADRNQLVSPLSLAVLISMIANGTDGETKAEIENTFGLSLDELNNQMAYYLDNLKNEKGEKLTIDNSLWIKENGIKVKEEFLQTNANYYGADAYKAPFDSQTAKDINAWVKDKTDGMIDKIIDGDIDQNTVMYLISTLLFDCEWENKYEKSDINNHLFTTYSGEEKSVESLYSKENYLKLDNAVGFTKYYKNGDYMLVGILPNEGIDVFDYAKTLTADSVNSAIENSSERAEVIIPKFEYKTEEMPLNDVIEEMGISQIFGGNADFSKLTDSDVFVSKIAQKTAIKLDENGTKAAAVTWGEMKATAMPSVNYVYLDRPFVYMICDANTNLPLFMGVVVDPTK